MDDREQQDRNALNRRDLLKIGALAGVGVLAASNLDCHMPQTQPIPLYKNKPMDTVRIGFVGVGGMGSNHVKNLLEIEGAQITALCDIVEEKVSRAQEWVTGAGFPKPSAYTRGETDFIRMCETEDLDLVYTATPWRWHVPVCLAAMKNDKHAATEVPAAVTLDECWQLVEAAEKYKKHCVMMENCCYDRRELMVLNMVRQGILGEILHTEGGYLHDLRGIKFSDRGEGLWRLDHSIKRNGNLYPTHGLGPIAQCMNINRGDVFDYMVSMSSPSRGLTLYAEDKFGPDSPEAKQHYSLGDVNSSLIKTRNGCSIIVKHDCNLPRPYSRINLVQGTEGIFYGYANRMYIEHTSPHHQWEDIDDYFSQYEHPLWKKLAYRGEGRGHGGMDYIEDYRLVQAMRLGIPTDMNVYDAAAWSVVTELSERSVANKSKPVDFPDFTRGAWKTTPPVDLMPIES